MIRMIGPEEEKIPRRVEKEPFQGEALVRHEHGVHLARDRMHELRVDAHIRAAPDRCLLYTSPSPRDM